MGEDLGVIGFDNRDIASVCRPALSTVDLPLFVMGQAATNTILDMIEKDSLPEDTARLMDCRIIERGSTG